MRKNLLMAALLATTAFTLVPTAAADELADWSGPTCQVADCVDQVCDRALDTQGMDVECSIVCPMQAEAGSISGCMPVCPASGTMWACPPCPAIDPAEILQGGTFTARACTLPCTQSLSECVPCFEPQPLVVTDDSLDVHDAEGAVDWTIRCPPPVCDMFGMTPSPCSAPCDTWYRFGTLGDIQCPVCPWPPTTMQACAICEAGDLCGICRIMDPCPPPGCDLEDRACHPEPMPWHCSANGEEPTGVVPATLDYLEDQGSIACGLAGTAAWVAVDQAGDTTHYAVTQAAATVDAVEPFLDTRWQIDDHGILSEAVGEVGDQGNLACEYLFGTSHLCFAGNGPASGACVVDIADGGGVVGDTLAYAEAACASADGYVQAVLDDGRVVLMNAVSAARYLGTYVRSFTDARAGDAQAYVDGTVANVDTLVEATGDAAGATVDNTCGYLVGSCP